MGVVVVPQVGFYCPDGKAIRFKDCFKECRMRERCVSIPVLNMMAEQRIWSGLPSTTQLIAGTREALLEIIKEYYKDIQNKAWIILGNKGHKSLEDADAGGTSEIAFKDKVHSGIADYYEPSTRTLWDRKVSGAFKVHKALGLVKQKMLDPSGATYKRSGKGFKAGDRKKINVWTRDKKTADKWEWILQTNRYAIWLDDSDRPVEQIKIEIIVRDGGLRSAATYGVNKNIVIIDIPILNRDYVLDYFNRKANMLRTAILVGWAPMCNQKECWQGRKCESYCSVADFCRIMPETHQTSERFAKMEPEILC